MPKGVEVAPITCNILTAGIGIAFVGLSSVILQKHYDHEIIISPVISEAFAALTFGCVLIVTEIIINAIWYPLTLEEGHRKSSLYMKLFIAAAVWKTIVAIVQLAVGLALFTPSTVNSKINGTMTDAFDAYTPALNATTEHVDRFQQDFQCCGLNDYKYWFDHLGGNDVTVGCCKDMTDKNCYKDIKYAGIDTTQSKIYTIGCYEAYTYKLADASLTAIILFFSAFGILVVSVISYIINVMITWNADDSPDRVDVNFGDLTREDATESHGFIVKKSRSPGQEIRMEQSYS